MSPTANDLWTPMAWAENGEVKVAYDALTEGTEGEPLLLATGLGANRRWLPDGLCRALAAQGFAVARYDQRDGGDSTHLPATRTRNPIAALFGRRGEAYTAEDMVDDTVAVLDALGWESAHLLGVSLGGAVVQRMALRYPDRVRTVTTMAAVPGDTSGLRTLRYIKVGTLGKFARLKFPDTPEGAVEAGVAVARLLASPRRAFDETAARRDAERNRDAGVYDNEAQSRQIGAQWHGPSIDAITRPTLVLHGEDDPLIKPDAGKAIASRVRGSRLVLLPRVGHELPAESWPTVAAELGAHAGVGGGAGPDDGARASAEG